MKKILAHSEKDAQKRRAAFEERFAVFNGHHFSLEGIKQKVNPDLEIKYLNYYLGESNKFSGKPNPIVCLTDGKFSFSEQGIRKALKEMGADLSLFKMDVQETAREADDCWHLFAYKKRKNVYTQVCTLTYKSIEMEITRWYVKDSPFGVFEIMPAKQMMCYVPEHCNRNNRLFILRDDEFYLLDLPTLLLDLALEYQLREEEITYHTKQLRITTMQTSVLDEDHITLAAIDEATKERIIKESERKGLDKEQTFKVLVQPWEVNFIFSETHHLTDPVGRQTVASFSVEGSEIIIDEALYDHARSKDRLIIFPNVKDRRFQLQISGSIGLHALVGYLKQMPALCQQMNKFAESLNF